MLGVGETPNILLTNRKHDTSHPDSGGSKGNDLVERYIAVVDGFVAERLHGATQTNLAWLPQAR